MQTLALKAEFDLELLEEADFEKGSAFYKPSHILLPAQLRE